MSVFASPCLPGISFVEGAASLVLSNAAATSRTPLCSGAACELAHEALGIFVARVHVSDWTWTRWVEGGYLVFACRTLHTGPAAHADVRWFMRAPRGCCHP